MEGWKVAEIKEGTSEGRRNIDLLEGCMYIMCVRTSELERIINQRLGRLVVIGERENLKPLY